MLIVPRCLVCGTKSDRVDLFRELQLSFPNTNYSENQTVQSMLVYYFKPEKLAEDNQCYCEICSQLTVREHITKIMAPPLKLFRYDPSSHQSIKMQHSICLDEQLIIDSWINQLYAVVIPCGSSVDSGHYFTISKDKNDWYQFNDGSVSRTSSEKLS
ncbi:unnamed protein product [Phaedon cochleariae]|uniref:USP domain-containing protein n=1 Tax=Phaedon cochleariae TaxID=80249 RepID=A0A9N9X3V5_PHACE|nr:unnamed protein product [Phaedon cochleariae]